eukprot:gene487-1893_t
MPSHDTKYLKDTVGDALGRACSACIEIQPLDPVEFTARFLLSYIENAKAEGEFYEQKRSELEGKKLALAAEQTAATEAKKSEDVKKMAIQHLANTTSEEPRRLLQTAVDLIKHYTSAGAVYVAMVTDPEEADWTPPEDPEDPTANESEDEEDPAPKPPPEDGEEQEGGGEAAAAEEEEGSPEDEEAPKLKIEAPLDYSKKYLSYMVTTEGQEFMKSTEIMRPPPPPEDADEDFKPDPVPFTFKILDERMPMVYCPNVAFDPSIKFVQNFPRIGAYTACGVQVGPRKEFKAIIAADTLFPDAGGQPLTEEELDFIWELTLGLQKAYNAIDSKAKSKVEGKSAKEDIAALLGKIYEVFNPPPKPPAEGDEGELVTKASATAPAVEEDDGDAEEGEGEGEGEGEEGEIDAEADPVGALKAEVNSLKKNAEKTTKEEAEATKVFELALAALGCIKESVGAIKADAVYDLRHISATPQATFHVLKAVFHILGKDAESFKNWKRAYEHFTLEVMDELINFDATAERDLAVWNKARSAYKGVVVEEAEGAPNKLEVEMPNTFLGVLLMMWIKQVRKVARRSSTQRGLQAKLAEISTTLVVKEAALAEAEAKKAEVDAEAARVAEEEAAKAAEEGGEEGEEGEGEEEDE